MTDFLISIMQGFARLLFMFSGVGCRIGCLLLILAALAAVFVLFIAPRGV